MEWCLPGPGDGGNGEILDKGNKLAVIKWICSGDLMYRMLTIGNNNALYTWKVLKK